MCGILCTLNTISIKDFISKLKLLQHRGQNSFGYCYIQNNIPTIVREKGLIKDYTIQTNTNHSIFLGHTRYVTSGKKTNTIEMPLLCNHNKFGEFVFVFNGNIDLKNYNYEVDSILIKEFLENCSENSFEDILIKFMVSFNRAYSLIIYHQNIIYCLRDRYGVRPLMHRNDANEFILSSELEERSIDIKCGEIIKIENKIVTTIYNYPTKNYSQCLFEYIYFMNKNTKWNSISVKSIREAYGSKLAESESKYIINNRENYIVIGIPKSGIPSAKKYAEVLNIKYMQLITKNKDINRTFILNNDKERTKTAQQKYIFNNAIKQKNIIIFDDSIVRGITMEILISKLKEFGANEIHIRIASPQIKYTCELGIDIPTKEELLMNKYNSIDKVNHYLGSNSLKFIELDKIKEVMSNYNVLCTGCFNNDYKLDW